MGFFDFMSVAGEDEITEKAEVSQDRVNNLREESISRKIAQLPIDGEKITVSVEGEVATVSGSAPHQAAMEKIVLCAGNQHGIGRVDCQIEVDAIEPATAPAESAPAAAAAEPAAEAEPEEPAPHAESTFYTVKSGDTLGKIAAQHYGDASKYPIIFAANKPMLSIRIE